MTEAARAWLELLNPQQREIAVGHPPSDDVNISGIIGIVGSQRLSAVQVGHVNIEAGNRQVVLFHF